MNLWKLLLAFIRRRPLTWAFHVLTLAMGVAVVSSLVLVSQAVERRFTRDLAGVDLVIGAKGSPLQLVLSALFQIDSPTGNISLAQAERFSRHPLVKLAVPVSMGDSVSGARILGTTPAYAGLYGAGLAEGRWWAQPMEAVVGAAAAKRLRLGPGSTFLSQHGLSGGETHKDNPYRVVGVLKPTGAVIDRLVLTDTASVWKVHEHHDGDEPEEEAGTAPPEREVTALLVRYRSPMGVVLLPQQVSATPDLQPASPAVETARLVNLLGVGADALRWIGLILLALSAGGFVVALYGAVSQRRRELALLRALGAGPGLLLALVAGEGALLGLAGGLLGAAASRVVTNVLASVSAASGPATLAPPPIGPVETVAVAAALLLGVLAALGPAVVASRTDPSRELAEA